MKFGLFYLPTYLPEQRDAQTHYRGIIEQVEFADVILISKIDLISAAEREELSAILEAMLFVSQDPLSPARLASVLGEVAQADLERAIQILREDLERPGRGLQLVEVAGGYRIMTRPDCAPWLKRLEKVKPAPKLSRSALETLAIIAYKQPVTRGDIEDIRGVVVSTNLIKALEARGWIRVDPTAVEPALVDEQAAEPEHDRRPLRLGGLHDGLERVGIPRLEVADCVAVGKGIGEQRLHRDERHSLTPGPRRPPSRGWRRRRHPPPSA